MMRPDGSGRPKRLITSPDSSSLMIRVLAMTTTAMTAASSNPAICRTTA
jgi:hypothetical protein